MKKFLALLLAVVMVFSMAALVGCGKDTPDDSKDGSDKVSDSAKTDGKKVKIAPTEPRR